MSVYYTKEHEWVRVDGNRATVGITDFAQNALGDIVFVELPEKGRVVSKGEEVGVVESVKTASDIYSPIGGTVTEGNLRLVDHDEDGKEVKGEAELVNADPEGEGWFYKLTLSDNHDIGHLMNADQYQAYCAEQG